MAALREREFNEMHVTKVYEGLRSNQLEKPAQTSFDDEYSKGSP